MVEEVVDKSISEDVVEGPVDNRSGGLECDVKPEFILPTPEHGPNKPRGQNKKRPKPMKFDKKSKICSIFVALEKDQPLPTCEHPNCIFQHDVDTYMKTTSSNEILDKECYVFKTFGVCPRGLSCRFRRNHVLEVSPGDWRNVRETGENYKESEDNQFVKNIQLNLRKKKVDFSKEDSIVENNFREREARLSKESGEPLPSKVPKLEDEAHPMHTDTSRNFKKIDWENKLYLAPLTTLGNLPFRRICKKFGADITCGEMAMGYNILQGQSAEWALLKRHSSEDLFGVQLCGCSPQQMTRVAKVVQEYTSADFMDINMGCPIDLVYKKGMGSGLMTRKKPLEVMIRSIKQAVDVPLTIKIRTGVYADKRLAHSLIPEAIDWGVDLITLHGRSREQRYTKEADWNYVRECVASADKKIPIFGNGDIMDFETYNRQKKLSGVNGVMIARGALIKPWIFTEIKEQRHMDISASERLDMIKDFAHYGLEHWGSDNRGIETTRRFLLEWLSFLHRYVPTGIQVHPPQKINERIPFYKGRDQMETLLCSPNAKDWVTISEMYLGKVPDLFNFEPKHMANSYN